MNIYGHSIFVVKAVKEKEEVVKEEDKWNKI